MRGNQSGRLFEMELVTTPRWKLSDDAVEEAAQILEILLLKSSRVGYRDIAEYKMDYPKDRNPTMDEMRDLVNQFEALRDGRYAIRLVASRLDGVPDMIFIDEKGRGSFSGKGGADGWGFSVAASDAGADELGAQLKATTAKLVTEAIVASNRGLIGDDKLGVIRHLAGIAVLDQRTIAPATDSV